MSRTFHALSDTGKILAKLEEVAGELSADLTDGGWTGKTITLKYKLDTFQGTPPWLGTGFGIREVLKDCSVYSREVTGQVVINQEGGFVHGAFRFFSSPALQDYG